VRQTRRRTSSSLGEAQEDTMAQEQARRRKVSYPRRENVFVQEFICAYVIHVEIDFFFSFYYFDFLLFSLIT
jgi:hypothetical protein